MGASSQTERNRTIVTDFVDLFYTRHQVREAFETYVRADYVQHNPLAADGRDVAIAVLVPAFDAPGVRHEVQRIVVDGDLAAVHVRATGGADDRGSAIIDIYRLEDGLIVEHWDVIQAVPEKSVNAHPMF